MAGRRPRVPFAGVRCRAVRTHLRGAKPSPPVSVSAREPPPHNHRRCAAGSCWRAGAGFRERGRGGREGGGGGPGGDTAAILSRDGTWGGERAEEGKREMVDASAANDADCDCDAGNVAAARLVCREHPLVPGVIIVEGTGPHRVSYEATEQSKGSCSGGGGGGDGDENGRVEEVERRAEGEGAEGEKGNEWRDGRNGREGKEGKEGKEGEIGEGSGRESEGRMERMKQVVVSRKCGEAVLRGANVSE
ncbi:unnamed protein product [Closterium sp. Yama58-4]|nr:unnamed protein product [Closterium sp. Yama58-4]